MANLRIINLKDVQPNRPFCQECHLTYYKLSYSPLRRNS